MALYERGKFYWKIILEIQILYCLFISVLTSAIRPSGYFVLYERCWSHPHSPSFNQQLTQDCLVPTLFYVTEKVAAEKLFPPITNAQERKRHI